VGDTVAAEDPLLTLESDKATLDVPSPVAGTVSSLAVSVGDAVSQGTVIGTVEVAGGAEEAPQERLTSQTADTAGTAGGGSPETAAGPAGGADRTGGLRVVGRATHRADQRQGPGRRPGPLHGHEG
jgi:pyruvate/2-oxoglutarate dehydrogenase complex dihydrolipoamide acyltransferase (E2) component